MQPKRPQQQQRQPPVAPEQQQAAQPHSQQQPAVELKGQHIAHDAQPLPEQIRLGKIEKITAKAPRQHVFPKALPGGQPGRLGRTGPGPPGQVEPGQQPGQSRQNRPQPAARLTDKSRIENKQGQAKDQPHKEQRGVVGQAKAQPQRRPQQMAIGRFNRISSCLAEANQVVDDKSGKEGGQAAHVGNGGL